MELSSVAPTAMQITIDLPTALQFQLSEQATHLNIPLETLILQTLNQQFTPPPPIPLSPAALELLSLMGTLPMGTTDLAKNHDRYIGEALQKELRNAE
jgi:hypothetical protein